MDIADGILFLLLLAVALLCVDVYFWRKNMAALDNLNTNIQKLTTDIDAFIASHGSNNEAQIQAAADAVADADTKVVAATPQS